ncbi:MAG: hypothetical protein ACLGSD_14945 [Acidobacteriota bacterium]
MTPPAPPASQPTSVEFSPTPPTQLAVNASTAVYAVAVFPLTAVANTNAQVTYSLSCGSPNACGTLSGNNMVGAATYTAPAAIPSGGVVTITATSVADTSLSASAVITIVPPIAISVSFFSAVPASMEAATKTQISALISNDVSANPQVKWSVSCPAADCGSFSAAETYSEQLTTYTAPSAIPSGGSVTITATSVTDATKSVSANITIQQATAQLADGAYVFQIAGLNSAGPVFTTGAFVAANGKIVGGEQDSIERSDQYDSIFSPITGGTYGPMPDGNLQVALNVPSVSSQPELLTGVMITGGHGVVAGVQGVAGTGTLDLQTGTAAPSGGYAILLSGGTVEDSSLFTAGILNIDGPGTISGKNSILDVQQYYGSSVIQLNPSTVSAPDAYGRVLMKLNPASNSLLSATDVAAYVIDASHMRIMVVGDPSNSYVLAGDLGGLALGQGANAGKFTAASLAGSGYVFAAEGKDAKGPLQLAGVCTLNSDGSATGVLNWNDLGGGAAQAPVAFKGTYTVDATGRVTLSNLTDGANFNYSLRFYLDGSGGGLVLSDDINDAFTGQAFERQTSPFSAASLSGRYGVSAGLVGMTPYGATAAENLAGWLTSTPSSTNNALAGYADFGNGANDFALTGTLNATSNGVFQGQITGLNGILNSRTQSASSTPNSFTLYMIDNTQAVLIETDNTQLLLGRLQLAQ